MTSNQQALTDLTTEYQNLQLQFNTVVLSELTPQHTEYLIYLNRATEQIADFIYALKSVIALQQAVPIPSKHKVHFHRDWQSAIRNGIRAMLAIVIAGYLWLLSSWDYGDIMLLILAPYCALLSTSPNPTQSAIQFVKGTVYAVPAAFICSFLILPYITGLPLLLLVLILFWLPGVYATSEPSKILAGLAYLVSFNTLAAAENYFEPNFIVFINQSIAFVLASLINVLVFQLILPSKPSNAITHLKQLVYRSVSDLLKTKHRLVKFTRWQHLQQHRISQLCKQLQNDQSQRHQIMSIALSSLVIGRELFNLDRVLKQSLLDPSIKHIVIMGLKTIHSHPNDLTECSRIFHDLSNQLKTIILDSLDAESMSSDMLHLILCLSALASLLSAHVNDLTQHHVKEYLHA
jgi:uncharacterized membrane protein YccC